MMRKMLCLLGLVFCVSVIKAQTGINLEREYDALYFYISPNRDLEQKLYVLHEDEKLYFQLVIIRETCDEQYSGIAKANAGDPEIDEDEEGNAYPAIEYRAQIGAGELIIREDIEKQRTRIMLDATSAAGHCLPLNEVILNAE